MINVDPDLGEILAFLEYKIRRSGLSQTAIQRELGWKRSSIGHILHQRASLRVDQLLQMLRVIEVEPFEFFSEVYGHRYRGQSEAERDLLWRELVRLLHENLEVFGERSSAARPVSVAVAAVSR